MEPSIFVRVTRRAAVLAGDEAPWRSGGCRWRSSTVSENADGAGLLFPLDDALVWDVAAQQIAPVAEPHRASAQAQSRGQPFHRPTVLASIFSKRGSRRESRIRIIGRRLPAGAMGCCLGHFAVLVAGLNSSLSWSAIILHLSGGKQVGFVDVIILQADDPVFPSIRDWTEKYAAYWIPRLRG